MVLLDVPESSCCLASRATQSQSGCSQLSSLPEVSLERSGDPSRAETSVTMSSATVSPGFLVIPKYKNTTW